VRSPSVKADADALRPIGLHECRHSFVTSMALSGIPIKALQLLAGHEDLRTTLDTYGHLYDGHENEAGRLVATFFEPTRRAEQELARLSHEQLITRVREAEARPPAGNDVASMPHEMPHEAGNPHG
jgi:integrase